MLKDEYNRLIALFHEAAEGKTPNLEEIFSLSLAFFEHLKEQIAQGTPEDKKEAMRMMSELYSQMIAESKRISERSGMTEEQLVSFAENPSNFTSEQWNSIQASKEKIVQAGTDLAKSIEGLAKAGESAIPHSEKEKKDRPKDKKSKKSGWMRS
jgi:hypothetical protein